MSINSTPLYRPHSVENEDDITRPDKDTTQTGRTVLKDSNDDSQPSESAA